MSKVRKRLLSLALAIVFVFSASTSAYASAVASKKATEAVQSEQEEASKISLSSKTLTLYVGKSSTLTLSGTVSKAKWKSSKKSVATVSKSGKVKAKKKGSAVISATVNGNKYYCRVTVKNPELNQTQLTVKCGDTAALYLNGAKIKSVSSSSKAIASVDKSGTVTANKTGTATINVKDTKGRKYKCSVTVISKLSSYLVTLNSGESHTLTITGSSIKSLSTSNSDVATVTDQGTITAKNAGNATVTVTDTDGVSQEVTVQVHSVVTTGDGKIIELKNGESKQIELEGATITSAESKRETIAIVSNTGKVTGVTQGSTYVEITDSLGRTHQITVKVTNSDVKLEKTSITVGYGKTVKLELSGTKASSVSSNDKSIASIDTDLTVTGIKCGTTAVLVNGENGNQYYCNVKVTPSLNEENLTLTVGKAYTLKLLNTGTIASINSDNQTVATVNSDGEVSAVAEGSANIDVTDEEGNSYTCKVTVEKDTTKDITGDTSEKTDSGDSSSKTGGDSSGTSGDSSSKGGDSSSGDSSGTIPNEGQTCTVYFKCTDDLEDMTLPDNKTYTSGDAIGTLEYAQCAGYSFLGWFYDKDYTQEVLSDDIITSDTVLYAQLMPYSTAEDLKNTFVAVEDADLDYKMKVQADSAEDVEKYTTLTCADDPDVAMDKEISKDGDYYAVTAVDGYEEGNTYTLTISDTSKVRIYYEGEVQCEECKEYNIGMKTPDSVKSMELNEDIRYIPIDAVKGLDEDEYRSGIMVMDSNGNSQDKSFNGTFTYKGKPSLAIGDTVAIYDGKKPTKRTLEDDQSGDAGEVIWVKITGVNGSEYSYENTEVEDVVKISNVLPVTKDMDTDGDWDNYTLVIDDEYLDFSSDRYAKSMLDSDTVLQVDDFVDLLDSMDDNSNERIGRITSIADDGTKTTIQFRDSSAEEFANELNVYEKLEEHLYENMSEEERQEFINGLEDDVENSSIIEEAEVYAANVVLESDEFKDFVGESNAESAVLTMDDGSAISTESLEDGGEMLIQTQDDSLKVDVEIRDPSIELSPYLKKIKEGGGIRIGIKFTVKLEISSTLGNGEELEYYGSESKLLVNITLAVAYEQAFSLNTHLDADLGWEIWNWCIEAGATVDLMNYIGIASLITSQTIIEDKHTNTAKAGATATALNAVLSGVKDGLSGSGSVGEFIDGVEKTMNGIKSNGGVDNTQTLDQLYSDIIQTNQTKAIRIFEQQLCRAKVPVISVGVAGLIELVFELDLFVDLTVNVTIGISYTYISKRRYCISATLSWDGLDIDKSSQDLQNDYEFQLYAVGHVGIYCGLEASVGFTIAEIVEVGLLVDIGPDFNIYGFMYVRLANTGKSGIWGSVYVTIDLLIKVKIYLRVGYGKLGANAQFTILEVRIPLASLGDRRVTTGYSYSGGVEIPDDIVTTTDTLELPDDVFKMVEIDMATGKYYNDSSDDYPARLCERSDFKATFVDNPDNKFSYDSNTGTITVNHLRTDDELHTTLRLTYVGGSISPTYDITSSEVPYIDIPVSWENAADSKIIKIDSEGNGISGLTYAKEESLITVEYQASLGKSWQFKEKEEKMYLGCPSNKAGYRFAGWQVGDTVINDSNKKAQIRITGRTVIQAVWAVRTDMPYKVNVYQQDVVGYKAQDSYTLVDSFKRYGTTFEKANVDDIEDIVADEKKEARMDQASNYVLNETKSNPIITISADESVEVNLYMDRDPFTITFRSISPIELDPIKVQVDCAQNDLWSLIPTDKKWIINGDYQLAYFTDIDNNIISSSSKDIIDENGDTVKSTSYGDYAVGKSMTLTAHWVKINGAKIQVDVYLSDGNGNFEKSESLSRLLDGVDGQEYQRSATGFGVSLGAYEGQYIQDESRFEVTNELDGDTDETFKLNPDSHNPTVVSVYYIGAGQVTLKSNHSDVGDAEKTVGIGSSLVDAFTETDKNTDKIHYTLNGIYRDADLKTPVTSSEVMTNGDALTLYADWEPVYTTMTVKYYTEGIFGISVLTKTEEKQIISGIKEFTAKDGTVCNMFTALANDTYGTLKNVTYDGIKYTNLGKNYIVSPGKDEAKTISYYYGKQTFTINWHSGTKDTTATLSTGANLLHNAPSVSYDGYTLLGWTDKDSLDSWTADWSQYDETKLLDNSAEVTADADYYAVWHRNNYQVNAEYYLEDINGEYFTLNSELTEEVDAEFGKSVNATIKTIDGFTFDSNNSGNIISDVADVKTVLKLYYKRNVNTVTWKHQGVIIQQKQYLYGDVLRENDMPMLTIPAGYTVNGWKNASTLVNSAITKDITIESNVEPIQVNVTYDAKDGTITKDGTSKATYDELWGTLPTVEREGYKFIGWYTQASGGTPVNEKTISKEIKDITLYAHWAVEDGSVVSYTVEHYMQDAETGEYALKDTVALNGVVGSETQAYANGYAHCKAKSFDQTSVAADGKTVVKIYYDLNTYKLTAKSYADDANPQVLTLRYGQSSFSQLTQPQKIGYNFDGWLVNSARIDGDIEVIATWTPKTDNTYVVKHMQEQLNGTYTLADTDNCTGTTAMQTTAMAKTYEHFTAQAFEQQTIADDGSTVITIQYKRDKYTATFVSDGETVATKDYAYKASVTPYTSITKTGYTFKGWTLDSENVDFNTFTMDADTTFTANWEQNKYTVTYVDGSSTLGTESVNYGEYAQANNITAPDKDGYTFIGWTATKGGNDIYNLNSNAITADTTLYPVYKLNTVALTVNQYVMDTTGNYPATPNSNTTVNFDAFSQVNIADYVNANYVTDKVTALYGAKLNNSTSYVNGDVTLTGNTTQSIDLYYSRNQYKVKWDYKDGNTTSNTLYSGAVITKPTDPTKTGSTFNGWNGLADNATVGTSDVTYTANWTIDTYSVTLHENSGVIADGKNVTGYTYGAGAELPTSADISRTGYTFNGWYENADFTGSASIIINTTDTGKKDYYAKWSPNSYNVTLNANSGVIADDKNVTSYNYGTGATLPTSADISCTGYTFNGWYSNADFTGNSVTAITATDMGIKEYYAKWTPNTYEVTLNTNDGTIADGMNVTSYTYGTSVDLPNANNISRTGYTFNGWYSNDDFTGDSVTAIKATDTDKKDYYAKWTVNTYQVTLSPNSGTIAEGKNVTSYTYGTGADLPTADEISRTGYTFDGWYEGTNKVTTIANNATGDVAYTAHWTANTYKITLHNGDAVSEQTYTYGVGKTLPTANDVTKENCNFGGWYNNDSFTGSTITSVSATDMGDKEYYLNWTDASIYTVSFDTEDGTQVDAQRLQVGNKVTQPENPTRDGYTFTGKWLKSDGTEWNFDSDTVTESITLKAQWTAVSYSVTFELGENEVFDANSLPGVDIQNMTYSVSDFVDENGGKTKTKLLPVPIKTGYDFIGWQEAGSTEVVIELKNGDIGDKTYTPKWTAGTFYVTLDANGGAFADDNSTTRVIAHVYDTAEVDLPDYTAVTRYGYTFAGWTLEQDGPHIDQGEDQENQGENQGEEQKKQGENQGEEQKNQGENQGEDQENQGKNQGEEQDYEQGNNPEDLTSYYTCIDGKLDTDVTYYAQWTPITCKILLYVNDGQFDDYFSQSITYGEEDDTFVFPTIERTGYTFLGWYDADGNKETQFDGNFDSISLEKSYTARWQVRTCTITLDTAGGMFDSGDTVKTIDHDYGNYDDSLETPTRTGYEFAGWYNGEMQVYYIEPYLLVDGDAVTYTAHWTANTYTVNLCDDYTYTATINHIYGDDATLLDSYALEAQPGKTFLGWFTEETGGTQVTEIPKLLASDTTYYAHWESVTYTVTYLNKDGAEIYSEEVSYGDMPQHENAAQELLPQIAGQEFSCWLDCDDNDSEFYTYTSIERDYTLKAKYNYYNVYLKLETYAMDTNENYVLREMEYKQFKVNDTVIPTEKGYTQNSDTATNRYAFDYATYDGVRVSDMSKALNLVVDHDYGTHTLKLYFKLVRYTVTWKYDEDTVISSEKYCTGDEIVVHEAPAMQHYNFVGWDSTPAATMGTEDLTYTAQWEIEKYWVVLYPNGGDGSSVYVGHEYDSPSIDLTGYSFNRRGYTLTGWNTRPDGRGETVTEIPQKFDHTLYYYAQWVRSSYDVTFKRFDYTTLTTETVAPSQLATDPSHQDLALPEGYHFDHWQTETYTRFDLSTPITEDLTLYPAFAVNHVTVTINHYVANLDGSYPTTPEKITTSNDTTAWENFNFDAHKDASIVVENGIEYAGAKVDDNSECQLSPSIYFRSETEYSFDYYYKRIKHNVVWKSDADTTLATDSYYYGQTIIPLENPTKEDYIFGGWDSIPADTMGTEDLTYTAKWYPKNNSVELNTNGGTIVTGYEVTGYNYDQAETLPIESETAGIYKRGYTLDGWYDNAECTGTPVTEIAKNSTGNKKYWAKWTEATYNITLDANGGKFSGILGNESATKQVSHLYNSAALSLSSYNPERPYYTFDGWYTDATDGTQVTEIASAQDTNVTYYAHWTPKTYTLKLYANEDPNKTSTSFAEYTESYATTVSLNTLTKPTRTGYEFDGWFTTANVVAGETALTEISNNGGQGDANDGDAIKLYARWKFASYNLTFIMAFGDDANAGSFKNPDSISTKYTYKTSQTLPVVSDVNVYEKDGQKWLFDGWYTDANCTDGNEVSEVGKATDIGDKTFYAKWKKAYTVTFDMNGGVDSYENDDDQIGLIPNDPVAYAIGSTVTAVGIPTKSEEVFLGWYLVDENGNVTTTKWVFGDYQSQYTPYGTPASAEDGAWLDDEDRANYPDPMTVEKNITLRAKWGPRFKVKYDLKGGTLTANAGASGVANISQESIVGDGRNYGTLEILTTNNNRHTNAVTTDNYTLSKEGYTLDGWYVEQTTVDPTTGETQTTLVPYTFGGDVTSDLTLIAYWISDNQTLKMHAVNVPQDQITGFGDGVSENGSILYNGVYQYSYGNPGEVITFPEIAERIHIKWYSDEDCTNSLTSIPTKTKGYECWFTSDCNLNSAVHGATSYTLPASENYYLTGNLQCSITVSAGTNANIYLNGHTLTGNGENAAITVEEGATLNLYDGSSGGKIVGTMETDSVVVYNEGIFNMYSGTISGNTATDGAGVYNKGTFTMSGGTISGNTSTNAGGGVCNEGTFTMSGGTISGNKATSAGCGIYNSGTFMMNDGTIDGNTANGDATNGGGVYNIGTFAFNNGSIINNQATNGGGVCNCKTLDMYGKISGNQATNGGGVYNDANGEVNVQSNAVVCNNTAASGGGVYNGGTVTLAGGRIGGDGNNELPNVATDGGGVYNDTTGTFNLNSGEIGCQTQYCGNKATNAGCGVYNSGMFYMNSGKIYGNTANGNATNGGGVYNAGIFYLNYGSIKSNNATNGGGVYNMNQFVMKAGSISNNNAIKGGGIYNCNFLHMTTASRSGGKITENTATDGGGVYNDANATFWLSNGCIGSYSAYSGNKASGNGGGVYNAGSFTMNAGFIGGNVAGPQIGLNQRENYGGGVYTTGTFKTKLDADIKYNYANAGAGGICVASGRAELYYLGITDENISFIGTGTNSYGSITHGSTYASSINISGTFYLAADNYDVQYYIDKNSNASVLLSSALCNS